MKKNFLLSRKNNKHKILKGDTVLVIAGNDKGKIGKILEIRQCHKQIKVVVEGCSQSTKHIKPSEGRKGSITKQKKFIDISNVSYYDVKNNIKSKIGYQIIDGHKKRICRATGNVINAV